MWTRVGQHGALSVVLGLSLLLNGWAITRVGWGNAYYSAAVRSMTQSWHNALYASFEPGGFVSVDKPPLSLWVQTISAKLSGFHQLSLLLPQVLAGTLAVWFVYRAVLLVSNRTAALVAALCLAVSPIHVMVSHSNNLDAVLVSLMSSAAYCGVRAAVSGRIRALVGASVLGGLTMTAKMLAGVPVMPGIALAFAWCAPLAWRARLLRTLMSVTIMVAVGLSWFAFVDLTPKSKRPYVGSSATNSAFQLAFERNGTGQVQGTQAGFGSGRGFPGGGLPGGGRFPGGGFPGGPATTPPTNATSNAGLGGLLPGVPVATTPTPPPPGGGFPGGPGGFGGAFFPKGFSSGQSGWLRLFNSDLGSQIAWLIPLALVGSVLALLRKRFRPSPSVAAIIIYGGWFASAAVAFSITKGLVHPYYTSSLAPPAATIVGVGVAETMNIISRRHWRWLAFPAGGIAATLAGYWILLRRSDTVEWRPFVLWSAIVAVVLGALIMLLRRFEDAHRTGGLVIVAGVLFAPAMWTQAALAHGVTPQLPYAYGTSRPAVGRAGLQPNGGFLFPVGDQKKLVRYLRAEQGTARWSVAVQSAGEAESLILSDGIAVMTLGGFIGNDDIISERQLRERIRKGDVRFFLVAQGGIGGGFGRGFGLSRGPAAFVPNECSEVPTFKWQSGDTNTGETSFAGGPTGAAFSLYDCKGNLNLRHQFVTH